MIGGSGRICLARGKRLKSLLTGYFIHKRCIMQWQITMVHIHYAISRYRSWNWRPCDYRSAQRSDDIAHESKSHVCPAHRAIIIARKVTGRHLKGPDRRPVGDSQSTEFDQRSTSQQHQNAILSLRFLKILWICICK